MGMTRLTSTLTASLPSWMRARRSLSVIRGRRSCSGRIPGSSPKSLPSACPPGRLAAAWTGDENAKKRADLKERFTDPDSDRRFLVVSIAAMAEGVDGMQRVCHTEVWLNRSFNGVHNEQAEGRPEPSRTDC